MINKIFSLLVCFTICFQATAYTAAGDDDYTPQPEATHSPIMIQVVDADVEETISELQRLGVKVLYHRDDILLTFVPKDLDLSTFDTRSLKRWETSKPRYNYPLMDHAVNFNDAWKIGKGIELPKAYDGSGVVIGVCDIGFDTRHPNFLTADGKECRIRKVTQYEEEYGRRKELSTAAEIYDWRTDDADSWHGTHTAGIAGGAFMQSGMAGMAPGADLVFSASHLSDVGLLAGVEDIIAYAKSVGKRAVINLSMGNSLGPHDGSSLFTRYLDKCADDAIICLSSGNDGNSQKSMRYDFTESKNQLMVRTSDWAAMHNYGLVDIWSADDKPFKFTLFLYNEVSQSQSVYFEELDFTDPSLSYWRVSADIDDPDYNETFAARYRRGYISVAGGYSPFNGRFNVRMEMDCETDEASPKAPTGGWALYWPSVKLVAEPGTHADLHITLGENFLKNIMGYPGGDNNLSISDLATGLRTISVGMTNNRDKETKLDGREITRDPEGTININSSYGTLVDGRVMPLTCAPGAFVISSMSGAYAEKHPETIGNFNLEIPFGDGNAYYISEIGTSMSCPFVAGTIATWLQADRTLTSEQVMQIIRETNTSDYPDPGNPRHGNGWFNPYAGMQKVVDEVLLTVSTLELPGVASSFENGTLHISNYLSSPLSVSLYNANGMKVFSGSVESGFSSFDLRNYPSGIYLTVLESKEGLRKVGKVFVR